MWEVEDENYEVAAVLHSHSADVKAVRWHPTNEILASASYDDTLKLYAQSDEEWRCVSTLAGHASTVWCLAFSPDGSHLVSCSDDRSVILWRDATGESGFVHSATLKDVHERAIYSIDWGSDAAGDLIATGGGDDAIGMLRATPDRSALEVLGLVPDAHAGDVNAVTWARGRHADAQGANGWLRRAVTTGVCAGALLLLAHENMRDLERCFVTCCSEHGGTVALMSLTDVRPVNQTHSGMKRW